MDINEYFAEVDKDIAGLKSDLFEIRHLLKYAFKEDIVEKYQPRSLSPIPKKEVSYSNRQFKPRNLK